MRLINAITLTMHTFGGRPPPYAILSHTWGQEEVSFQDFQLGPEHFGRLRGYAKIEGCCRQARKDGYEWVWVDTCCIDKSSSAELSEAINSMYKWYQGSDVCYVYLADMPRLKWNTEQRNFLTCRWFTRGWTLQELIAPRHVDFYAEDWSRIGTRLSLAKPIHYRTGIPVEVLRGKPPSACLACQKMSWAAHRETSRKEDMAYCLMGIFEVNMPLLYGEGGDEAFRRLQEEILKRSEDLSLLAWSSAHFPNDDPEVEMQRSSKNSFLAASPADFSEIRTWGAPEVIRSKFHIHQKQLQWRDVHAFS
ncbi:heterokaryon incompatibility protein-domain-containing protein, partial [Diplogelasinospora grovesii]